MLFIIHSFIGLLAFSTQVEAAVRPRSHTLISRQSSSQQPQLPTLSNCSQSCLAEGMPVSGCDPTDAACLCTSVTFTDAVGACLTTNCTVVDALESQRYSAITCDAPVRDHSSLTKRVSWTMFTLATIGLICRIVSRLPVMHGSGFGWDDWTILLCWILLIPSDGILTSMADTGLGQDIWMLHDPNYQINKILYLFYVSEYTYVVSVALVKVSILLLYLRMWPQDRAESAWFRIACFVLIGMLSAFTVIEMIVLGVQCNPISFSWTRWDGQHEGTCINLNALIFATAAINIIFDFAVILLPIPKLWSLSIATRKKVAVCITFSIGLFVTLCSIIRLRTLAVWGDAPNVTWLYNPIAIWSNTEINLGVLCACIPAIAGLIQRSYTLTTGKKFSSYGRHSTMLRSGGQNEDRNYEVRLNSFSDGTARFHGYNVPKEEVGTKPPPVVRVTEEASPFSEPSRPTQQGGGADSTTEQMINAGYSAFASFKR